MQRGRPSTSGKASYFGKRGMQDCQQDAQPAMNGVSQLALHCSVALAQSRRLSSVACWLQEALQGAGNLGTAASVG